MTEWTTVASTADLAEGLAEASLNGAQIVIVSSAGEYRALSATCTHAGCNLAEDGDVEDGQLSCMCHGSIFDLETGEAVGPPAEEPLTVYATRVEGDEIQVAGPR